jgi:hypothetical protein
MEPSSMERIFSIISEAQQQSDDPKKAVEALISSAVRSAFFPEFKKANTTSSNHIATSTSHGGPSLTSTELGSFPETQRMIQQSLQDNPTAQGLTPLTLLDQICTRLNLECRFIEFADSPTGPFRFQCQLFRTQHPSSPGGASSSPIISGGQCSCKTKKAAKQLAASSLLELVLPVLRRGGNKASKSQMVALLQSPTAAADFTEASSVPPSASVRETQPPPKSRAHSSSKQHLSKPLPPQQRPLKLQQQQQHKSIPLPPSLPADGFVPITSRLLSKRERSSEGESANEGEESNVKRQNNQANEEKMDVLDVLDDVRRLLQGAGIKPI